MKQKLLHYTKEILLFIVIMTLFANLISWYKSQELNKESSPIENVKLINNNNYASPKQKSYLVHFWATWCPTCKLEADNIERISQSYEVVSIAVKSGTDYEIKNYLDAHHLTFQTINDKHGDLSRKFNISAYPTTFIYDKNGNLVFSEVGYTSSLGPYLRMWWADL